MTSCKVHVCATLEWAESLQLYFVAFFLLIFVGDANEAWQFCIATSSFLNLVCIYQAQRVSILLLFLCILLGKMQYI